MISGQISHYDLLLADFRDLVLAGTDLADPESFQVELPSDPRHICSRLIERFMDKAIDEYLNLYRMVCLNRCRTRRTFTQAISIFDAMEAEALRVDGELRAEVSYLKFTDKENGGFVPFNPLSSWARFYRLQVMASLRLLIEIFVVLTCITGLDDPTRL